MADNKEQQRPFTRAMFLQGRLEELEVLAYEALYNATSGIPGLLGLLGELLL